MSGTSDVAMAEPEGMRDTPQPASAGYDEGEGEPIFHRHDLGPLSLLSILIIIVIRPSQETRTEAEDQMPCVAPGPARCSHITSHVTRRPEC